MCLVLVGSKESNNPDQEGRVSWSPAEIILICKLPNIVKQGFIAAKFTFKSAIKIIRDEKVTTGGRSHVGSYHLKTTFLHRLEKTPPHKINSPFCLMINLLHYLQLYLIRGTLPHYFIPECNLLTTIGHDERQIALEAIQAVVSDPVKALATRWDLRWYLPGWSIVSIPSCFRWSIIWEAPGRLSYAPFSTGSVETARVS